MEYRVSETAEGLWLGFSGRLEFTDHERLPEIVDAVRNGRSRRAVLDLSELEFIDSAGLGMLLILHEEAETMNLRLVVRGARGAVKQSLDLAKLNEILSIEG
ncbi:STAS domain-containing protein [Azospirillum thermophilum]|uniref:Anti-sigma factor antagonist n=1 Tax=Azospirillum thermophilum TaxID=2202148 RepID=A0A2S2CSH7_9PROT|nr:STAS domain-containing protein [Azospirillum thermophilum]AWK87428.1 anti-sigma factor antagonist [Azospirillum thermophilum]